MAITLDNTGIVFADGSSQTTAENLPSGLIIMWTGDIMNIPSGWYLCDGTNGTPNLVDKFVVSTGVKFNVNDVGGNANTLVYSHTHTNTFNTSGDHFHDLSPNTHTHSTITYVSGNIPGPGAPAGAHNHTGQLNSVGAIPWPHSHPSNPITTPTRTHTHPGTANSVLNPHTHPITVSPVTTAHSHGGTGFPKTPQGGSRANTPPTRSHQIEYDFTTPAPWAPFMGAGPAPYSYSVPHDHLVTFTSTSSPGHSHTLPVAVGTADPHSHPFPGTPSPTITVTISSTTVHNHNLSITSWSPSGDHYHDGITINANNIPSSPANNHNHLVTISPSGTSLNTNLPPYYALAFLMKA